MNVAICMDINFHSWNAVLVIILNIYLSSFVLFPVKSKMAWSCMEYLRFLLVLSSCTWERGYINLQKSNQNGGNILAEVLKTINMYINNQGYNWK